MWKRRGFTLIELLVVIGIIALLLAILLPVVSRVRFQAQCAVCASNLRQIATAASHYATDNNGRLPAMLVPGTSSYPYDVSAQFEKMLSGVYKVPQGVIYCPLLDQTSISFLLQPWDQPWNLGAHIGYSCWIPRPIRWGNPPSVFIQDSPLPPLFGGQGTYFLYPTPLDSTTIAGPQLITDSDSKDNPILTDIVVSTGAAPSSMAHASDVNNSYTFSSATLSSQHQWHARMDNINAAYADGHVDTIRADAVKPRYGSNSVPPQWFWR
jgi:prepilin-type N-terminal cleavage/methylation domain-containing protein/prepilin-type processing-associated H-X9-DG protein